MKNKKCPKCSKQYYELSNFCKTCGHELIKEENRCSKNGHSMCAHGVFEESDVYCEFCGALTTYAAERQNKTPETE